MRFHVLTATLLLIAAGAWGQAPNAADSQGLIAKSEQVQALVKAKDVNALKSSLTDDFRNIGSDGGLRDRNEFIGEAQEGTLRNVSVYNARYVPVDATTGLVTYNVIVDRPEGDDQLAPRYQSVVDVWVKQGDEWRLKFEQATPQRHID